MQRRVLTLVGLGNFVVMSAVALPSQVKPSILQGINLLLRKKWCWVRLFVSFRVYDQHKLSKDQWEDRIKSWWGEHKGMMRSALLPTSPIHSWSLWLLALPMYPVLVCCCLCLLFFFFFPHVKIWHQASCPQFHVCCNNSFNRFIKVSGTLAHVECHRDLKKWLPNLHFTLSNVMEHFSVVKNLSWDIFCWHQIWVFPQALTICFCCLCLRRCFMCLSCCTVLFFTGWGGGGGAKLLCVLSQGFKMVMVCLLCMGHLSYRFTGVVGFLEGGGRNSTVKWRLMSFGRG